MRSSAMPVRRVLFVCLGNICRSPTAEAVARGLAGRAGIAADFDSAGPAGWHVGEPPHPAAVAAAARRGDDLPALQARQVARDDPARFDLILTMDRRTLRDLARIAPPGARLPRLFLSLAPALGLEDLPDPWHTGAFGQTLDLIEAAAERLIARLSASRP